VKRGIKHHHLPGDVSKQDKIRMSEGALGMGTKRSKTFRDVVLMKERAVLKERDNVEINQGLEETNEEE
jgi:hypothetical protein